MQRKPLVMPTDADLGPRLRQVLGLICAGPGPIGRILGFYSSPKGDHWSTRGRALIGPGPGAVGQWRGLGPLRERGTEPATESRLLVGPRTRHVLPLFRFTSRSHTIGRPCGPWGSSDVVFCRTWSLCRFRLPVATFDRRSKAGRSLLNLVGPWSGYLRRLQGLDLAPQAKRWAVLSQICIIGPRAWDPVWFGGQGLTVGAF